MEYIAITEDLYLSHHGVKGMKWGVRKERSSSGDLRRKVALILDRLPKKIAAEQERMIDAYNELTAYKDHMNWLKSMGYAKQYVEALDLYNTTVKELSNTAWSKKVLKIDANIAKAIYDEHGIKLKQK